ncbi:MAG: hypothetical protein ABR502_05225 [Chitinophagaceae bacterium]
MNNSISMSAEFEKQKKVRASAITFGTAGSLLLLFILIKWPLPNLTQPVIQDFIEVNLGSGDQGFGPDQPMLPGEPAQAEQMAYQPPQPVQSRVDNAKDVETDDRPDNDAPAIRRPAVVNPNATKIDNDNKVVRTNNPQPVVTQAPPRPKAVLGRTVGGNGNGGNGADRYERGGNEGIAGGSGDQGRPGGDPNGRDYTGPRKNFGVRVLQISNQSFEDEFNENAKVAMDVMADASGKVTSASYQPRGSTTSTRQYIEIARRSAFQLKLGSSDGGQKGTVIFNFKVRG